MANVDLAAYNLTELKGLQSSVEQELKNRQNQDLQRAKERILEIAQSAGMSIKELLAESRRPSKGMGSQQIQARYRNPSNANQTWTGRGRQPRWIVDGLASGKSIDDFRD